MKRVCHVTSAHKRYDTRIFQKECRSLAKEGYDTYLVVNDEKEAEEIDGVKIYATGFLPKTRKERFLNSHSLLLKKAEEVQADIYHFHDPDLLDLALKLKKKTGAKIIFDSHEDVPAQILDKEWIPTVLRKPLSYTYRRYMNYQLRKFDYIIGVTPTQVEHLRKIGSKVEMVTNYPILEECNETINKTFNNVICFAGGISNQWNHMTILDAITDIDVRFILCGASNAYLEKMEKHPVWEKVDYRGEVPFRQVKEILEESAVAMVLCGYSANTAGKYGTLGNTKLFEGMQAGLPVICTDFTLWKEIILKYECGICVNPYDSDAVKNAILEIFSNPEKAKQMGKNGIRAIESEYNWNVEEKKLLNLYRTLV